MHPIYHTKAVILRSQTVGEANKRYWLFTEELGLVVAVATGVRKHASKLAGQLSDYGFINVDLVHGREVWRLVSATASHNPLAGSLRSPLARSYVRTLNTVERFVGGEGEQHSELFCHIQDCAELLDQDQHPQTFDTLAIWRVLAHLGYIAVPENSNEIFSAPLSSIIKTLDTKTIKSMIKQVNTAITYTHL